MLPMPANENSLLLQCGRKKSHDRAKEKRGNQREELESYLETVSSFGILLINSDLNILDCNQGFMKIVQLQQKPFGSPVEDFLMLGAMSLDILRSLDSPATIGR